MVEDEELRELYSMLYSVVRGYNRTHGLGVSYLDFACRLADGGDYSGSLVYPVASVNLLDVHYRELDDSDDDWYGPEDWDDAARLSRCVDQARRRDLQRMHREGSLDSAPAWMVGGARHAR